MRNIRTKVPEIPATVQRDAARRNRYKHIEQNLYLVRALTFHYPSHLTPAQKGYIGAWNWLICIHLPEGPVCWRLTELEESLFAHLERVESHPWDRASQAEKTRRIAALGVS